MATNQRVARLRDVAGRIFELTTAHLQRSSCFAASCSVIMLCVLSQLTTSLMGQVLMAFLCAFFVYEFDCRVGFHQAATQVYESMALWLHIAADGLQRRLFSQAQLNRATEQRVMAEQEVSLLRIEASLLRTEVARLNGEPDQLSSLSAEELIALHGHVQGTSNKIQREIMERHRNDADAALCPICLDRPKDTALISCGHVLCATCALWAHQRVQQCPTCRSQVNGRLRIFIF